MKFQIGQKVTTKRLGLPSIATVFGCLDSETFIANELITRSEPINMRWTELYPNWRQKPVYYFKFLSPQRVCSIDEFIHILKHKDYLSQEDIVKLYNMRCPKEYIAVGPEDDLELYDEN